MGLSSALFSVTIKEEIDQSKIKGWLNKSSSKSDIRLFHVYDNNIVNCNDGKEEKQTFIGSFYVDPYRRIDKSNGIFTGTIYDTNEVYDDDDYSTRSNPTTIKSKSNCPLLYMS